jgi:type VI secretion system protein ImpE
MFEDLLREGDLSKTLTELQGRIRKDPSNAKLRTFLFQLLSVDGNWDRALTQLKVVGDIEAASLPMVQTYREALQCEALRTAVFAGERSPLLFGEPQHWMALLLEALRLSANGAVAQSQEIRAQAFDLAPTSTGNIEGAGFEAQPFAWLADADPRLGPMVEAIINGRYYWLPLNRLRQIDIEAPEDLRDVVWLPAHLTLTTGGETVALLSTRYPGSELAKDPALRLARRTDWIDQGEDLFIGLGQRMFASDAGEYPIMDVRRIVIDVPDA